MSIQSTSRSRHWMTAAACCGALLLAGCGSTADTASTGTSPAAASSMSESSAPSSSSASPLTVTSSSASEAAVTIADAWVRATVGTEDPTMTAAFGILTNHTDQDLTVMSATNDVSDRTELHEMAMVDGAMVMRPIAGGILIPAGGSTTLEPGGLHVMIMDATTPVTPGDDVHVTLTLSDGSSVLFHATAKEFAGGNETYDGGSMDMGTSGAMDMGTTAESHDDGTEASHTNG